MRRAHISLKPSATNIESPPGQRGDLRTVTMAFRMVAGPTAPPYLQTSTSTRTRPEASTAARNPSALLLGVLVTEVESVASI